MKGSFSSDLIDLSVPSLSEVEVMGEDSPLNEALEKASANKVNADDGEILEAESSLREGLSLNYEEARALLGRLEYHKGNIEAALRVFDGINLQAAIHRMQSSLLDRISTRKSGHHTDLQHSTAQHAAALVLEAIYLKAKSLQKLGRASEAAHECKSVLDAVEKMFHHGIPDVLVENKLQGTVCKAVELLPELWEQAGLYQEALTSYRRALLGHWNLEDDCRARLQKRFAVLLLYGGVEANPPSLAAQTGGSFVPKNNLEEAVLLLMILLNKCYIGQIQWDASLMDHFIFAFCQCSETNLLSRHIEEVLPGMYPRSDRWYTLSLCLCGAGQKYEALNLLRKVLNKYENPGNLRALLLAAKICSKDCALASEGIYYSQTFTEHQSAEKHLKSMGLHFLGICLGNKAKNALFTQERCRLQDEALSSLEAAVVLDHHNLELIFDLGLQYAEQGNMNAAISCAKTFIDGTGGSLLEGWRFLALLLFAQGRYFEAEVATDAGLDETSKWEQGPLLRIKTKIKATELSPMDAVDTYCSLLALLQAQKKSLGLLKSSSQLEDFNEFEVWQDLACLYCSLSQWKDAEACLEKATSLKPYAASLLHLKGSMHEARSNNQAALSSYSNALFLDPNHAPSKVSLGALLWRIGSKPSAIARSFLSDALRLQPTSRKAWYYLGLVHRDDGRHSDAADCFLAASMLEESKPVDSI